MNQQNTTFYCYVAFAIIGVVHSAFVIFFAIMEDVKISQGETYDENKLE